jgi:flagellar biosynthetic protein FliQ
MDEMIFFDSMRFALQAAVRLSFPILAVALAVGLFIGLFQALTSIQELTLTFVPKLAAMLAVFWISMGFMSDTLVNFFHETVLTLMTRI